MFVCVFRKRCSFFFFFCFFSELVVGSKPQQKMGRTLLPLVHTLLAHPLSRHCCSLQTLRGSTSSSYHLHCPPRICSISSILYLLIFSKSRVSILRSFSKLWLKCTLLEESYAAMWFRMFCLRFFLFFFWTKNQFFNFKKKKHFWYIWINF